jgi:hypothetical protein
MYLDHAKKVVKHSIAEKTISVNKLFHFYFAWPFLEIFVLLFQR